MKLDLGLPPDRRDEFLQRMRVPAITFAALMVLLGVNVALGATMPFSAVWIVEMAVAVAMVVVVLLFSMEVIEEPPLMKLFSVLGFCWVGILFTMTLVDYLTR